MTEFPEGFIKFILNEIKLDNVIHIKRFSNA